MSQDAVNPVPAPNEPTSDIPIGIPMARPISAPSFAAPYDPLLLLSEPRGHAWADIGIVVLVLIALEISIGTLIGLATGAIEGVDENVAEQLNSQLISEILFPLLSLRAIAASFVIFAIARHRRQRRASVGLQSQNVPLDTGLGFVTPPVVYGICYCAIILTSLFRPNTLGELQENAKRLMEIIPPLPIWAYPALALIIGVYEELLFRGFLMPRIRRATGSWVLAVIVSTALFTLLHAGDQTTTALIMVSVLSLAFSLLTILRRSIVPAVIAHTLWDLSQFLLLHFLSLEDLA